MAENIEFRLQVIEDKLSKALDDNEKKAKSLGSTLTVALGSFASAVAVKGIGLLADGLSELAGFMIESAQASAESETALRRLEVALAQTGQLSAETVKNFQDFATEIQKTTAFEDDAVITNIALLQSMAKLDEQGLKKATEGAINLASAFNIDLETATRLVGKSADGNISAFSKLGIEIDKGATKAETFANTLKVLDGFQGNAEAQAKTFAGSLTQLKNIYGDLKESIGSLITQNPAIIAGFQTIKTVLSTVGESILKAFGSGNSDQLADFFRLLFDSSAVVVTVADAIGRAFNLTANLVLGSIRIMALGIVTPIAGVLELVASIPKIGDAFKGASEVATAEMNRLSDAIQENAKGVNESLTGETFLGKITDGIAEARGSFDAFYADVKTKGQELENIQPPTVENDNDDDATKQRKEQLNRDLLDLDNQYYLSKNQIELENEILDQERFLKRSEDQINALAQFELDKSELQYLSAVENTNALASESERALAKDKALKEKELRNLNIQNKAKKDLRAQEIQDQQTFFSTATSLSNSSNKELATIGKLSALTQIAIQTPQAVASSFNFGARIGGPPLGFALGAIALTAMSAQAAKVAGVKGFEQGGVIGNPSLGATIGSDNKLATVRDGEMILNAQQQKVVFDGINSGSLGSNQPIIIQIDGKEIFRAVRNQLNQGMKFA